MNRIAFILATLILAACSSGGSGGNGGGHTPPPPGPDTTIVIDELTPPSSGSLWAISYTVHDAPADVGWHVELYGTSYISKTPTQNGTTTKSFSTVFNPTGSGDTVSLFFYLEGEPSYEFFVQEPLVAPMKGNG